MKHHYRHKTRAVLSAVIACIALGLSGCSDTPEADPAPEAIEATPTVSSSPTPTADPDGWRAKYRSTELEAYDAALGRWKEYESRSEPIWAKGKATPTAQELFKEYWTAWAPMFIRLQDYEKNGLAVSGTAKVLTSKASLIDLSGQKRVVIKQCIDPAPITVTEHGEADAPTTQAPYTRTITLDRVATTNLFMISGVKDVTTLKKVTPCGS